jgi:signal transduction histidine kinase
MRNNSFEILFAISLFIPLFMGILSYLSYRRHKDKEFAHLTEFWASLVLNVVFILDFSADVGTGAALALVGWIWPLRTFRLVLEDMSGKEIMHRWHYIALGAGAFITFAMGGYGFPFMVFTLPFSFAVGCIGLFVTYESWKNTSKDILSSLHLASYFLFGLFFIRRLTYPFWRMNPDLNDVGLTAEIFFLVGFAGTGISTYMEMLKRRHDEALEKVLKERSEKFLGQSKFSELGMMSAGIAHEINNPLAVIQARTTQLLRIYRNPERQKELAEGLQQILYTSERINKTIQGVREFVHQDDKGPVSEITLKDIFDDVLAFTGQRMKNHGVNLRFYGLENFSVVGHKIQLEQVILNLLNNSFDAIEYLPDKWIEVSCHERDGKIQMFFKDSGHGIPQEIASRMMEPFFSTKDIGKGTGLGLALAKGIVEKHGGTLSYLPHCPHTTFLMELPKTQGQEWGIPLH